MKINAVESVCSSGPMGDVEITIKLNLQEVKTIWSDMCDIGASRIEPSTEELRCALRKILQARQII